jgi:hypothetical protein
MPNPDHTLLKRLDNVRQRLRQATLDAGRKPEELTLIAVSKTHPPEAIAAVHALGHLEFGENYVQEFMPKYNALQELSLRWHFIGHLQSNKAKFVAGRFNLIHTVDSIKLAQNLHKCMEQHAPSEERATENSQQDILIQVNIGEEEQKGGVSVANLAELTEEILKLERLRLLGLMCIPPLSLSVSETRPYFVQLRKLRDQLEQDLSMKLPHLSMGMSHDFETAIAEGATLVRVGTDIFGHRDYAQG